MTPTLTTSRLIERLMKCIGMAPPVECIRTQVHEQAYCPRNSLVLQLPLEPRQSNFVRVKEQVIKQEVWRPQGDGHLLAELCAAVVWIRYARVIGDAA